jgi:hypothetical protein
MRYLAVILAAAIAISLAGCVLKGKPATASAVPVVPKPAAAPAPPPAPPPPLSVPQTHPELPAPQPVSAEALATAELPGEPPAPPPAPPKAPRKGNASSARRNPEAAPPTPAVVAPPAEPDPRPPIQEIVPAEDLTRLKASADAHKLEIRNLLEQLPRRGQTTEQKAAVDTIRSFVRLSDEAERSGDMRKANELAERGLVLAQGLRGAR